MNNDLEQFSEEYLKELINSSADELTIALARIALAAKQAKPVNSPCEKCKGSGFMDSGGTQPWGEPISVECDCTTPQPAHTEQDGWIKCNNELPKEDDLCLAIDDQGVIWTMIFEDDDFYPDTGGACPNEITHWMPLPADPKPESES